MSDDVQLEEFYDVHVHVDPSQSDDLSLLRDDLDQQMSESGCSKAVALHLPTAPWSARQWCEHMSRNERLIPFVSVDLRSGIVSTEADELVSAGARGFKIHPRLQGTHPLSPPVVELVQTAGELGVPVLIDAFFDWRMKQLGVTIDHFGELAQRCPQTRICIAHAGSPYVLESMFIAKELRNVYLDISFATLYFRTSHVTADILYAISNMRGRKIMYGSDYPDRSMHQTITETVRLMDEARIGQGIRSLVLRDNFMDFLG